MKIDIGIPEDARKDIAQGLSKVLADTYGLYLKTHNYHWNVTGPMFQSLHQMFEEQYNALALAVDEVAERIRALGERAPGSYTEFAQLSAIKDETGTPSAREMIANLVRDHETAIKTARHVFPRAQDVHDEASVDLLIGRIQWHEKTAWMLRSMLSD